MHDSPLAMLDAATVAKDDLIPYSLIFPGRKGYNYAAKYNSDHRQVQLLCPVCTTILQCLLSVSQNTATNVLLCFVLQSSSYMPLPAENSVVVCKRIHRLSEQTTCDAANFAVFLLSFDCYRCSTIRRYTGSVHLVVSCRWYYAKGITADEAYVFVCYDSREGRARFTPHTGFTDPSTPADAVARHSIETRAFVFWEHEPEQDIARSL